MPPFPKLWNLPVWVTDWMISLRVCHRDFETSESSWQFISFSRRQSEAYAVAVSSIKVWFTTRWDAEIIGVQVNKRWCLCAPAGPTPNQEMDGFHRSGKFSVPLCSHSSTPQVTTPLVTWTWEDLGLDAGSVTGRLCMVTCVDAPTSQMLILHPWNGA